jgi:hypothetical protein
MRLNFFTPPPISGVLPVNLQAEIDKLKKPVTKEEVLHSAYDLIAKKYRGYRIKTVTRLWELFDLDASHWWAKEGFLHCTSLNYLLRIMLVGSGKFTGADIRFKWTTVNFISPHQFMQVRLDDGKWIDVDLWGKAYGVSFGDHAHGFHSGTITAKL